MEALSQQSLPDGRVIFACDLGLISGWAAWDGTRVESGTHELKASASALRLAAFREWVAPKLADRVCVIHEAPHLRGIKAAMFLSGLTTALHEACAKAGVPAAHVHGVHSLTLKKFTTQNGHATKAMMYHNALGHEWLHGQRAWDGTLLTGLLKGEIAALDDRFDPTNNQVDAICLLYYGASYFMDPPVPLPGDEGYAAPPPVRVQKTKDERLLESLAWRFDASYADESEDE